MDELKQIRESIESNNYITPELKENIIELMEIFNKKMPDIDLSIFKERIKTLKIFQGNKFIIRDTIEYDSAQNILFVNKEELAKRDGKNRLMYGLLCIISTKGNYSGFNENNQFKALNIGVAEMIVNYLVGSGYEC